MGGAHAGRRPLLPERAGFLLVDQILLDGVFPLRLVRSVETIVEAPQTVVCGGIFGIQINGPAEFGQRLLQGAPLLERLGQFQVRFPLAAVQGDGFAEQSFGLIIVAIEQERLAVVVIAPVVVRRFLSEGFKSGENLRQAAGNVRDGASRERIGLLNRGVHPDGVQK